VGGGNQIATPPTHLYRSSRVAGIYFPALGRSLRRSHDPSNGIALLAVALKTTDARGDFDFLTSDLIRMSDMRAKLGKHPAEGRNALISFDFRLVRGLVGQNCPLSWALASHDRRQGIW
jgi:hypothetical protein